MVTVVEIQKKKKIEIHMYRVGKKRISVINHAKYKHKNKIANGHRSMSFVASCHTKI